MTWARARLTLLQILVVAALLASWEWVPTIRPITSKITFLDRFFVSSPSAVVRQITDMATSGHGAPDLWAPLVSTLIATAIGTAAGVFLGLLMGLLFSSSQILGRVFGPLVVAANAVPRIALVPITVVMFGPNLGSAAVTAFILVVFIVFFNAFEGGRSVQAEQLDSARVMGASSMSLMVRVRFMYVVAWTFAALPNAVAFGLVGVVTAELLSGSQGIGQLLVIALNSANATQTFAIVVVLALVGIIVVTLTDLARRRALFWWDSAKAR